MLASALPARVEILASTYRCCLRTKEPRPNCSFWDTVAAGATALADTTRRIYNSHGQTYTLYVLSYFVVLYAACGGFHERRQQNFLG